MEWWADCTRSIRDSGIFLPDWRHVVRLVAGIPTFAIDRRREAKISIKNYAMVK
jgi:hypothetical protein